MEGGSDSLLKPAAWAFSSLTGDSSPEKALSGGTSSGFIQL